MKKDVVGMDRPASEEGPTLEERVDDLEWAMSKNMERVEYIRTECIQHWNAMEQRVAELENDSNHRMDLEDDVIERVAYLEKFMAHKDMYLDLQERVARLERAFELALADWGENEPLPWGDLD